MQTLKKPGRHADGAGLYLSIDPTGARKRSVFLFTVNKKQREAGLGPVGEVSLAEARRKADALRVALWEGRDPLQAKESPAAIPTFGEVEEAHIAAMEPAWRNAKHVEQWRMTLSVERGADGGFLDSGSCGKLRATPADQIIPRCRMPPMCDTLERGSGMAHGIRRLHSPLGLDLRRQPG